MPDRNFSGDTALKLEKCPITVNAHIGNLDPLEVRSGPAIVPVERMKLFSPSDWEGFVNEWVSSLNEYSLVERLSGAGDMGCDIIGTVDSTLVDSPWDNYQCKHYDHPLAPSDVWLELGKFCYYTFTGAYTVPRRYNFVAPRGVGTKLARILKRPADLKAELITQWKAKCATGIVSGQTIPLSKVLLAHINDLNFSIFGYIPAQRLIEEHSKTRYFAVRFGLGLPQRPPTPHPPENPTDTETRYVQQLMAAYGDHLQSPVASHLALGPRLLRHFQRARESFYCAEALRNFSRDTLPDGAFENLQKQIHDGVVDLAEAAHACGLTRLKATTAQAATLSITSSALMGRVEVADRHGVCHQLANEDRLTWVPTNE